MQFSRQRQITLLIYLLSFLAAIIYFIFIALPVLIGETRNNAFVGDSFLYMRLNLNSFIADYINDIVNGKWIMGAVFGYIGVGLLSSVMKIISGGHLIYAIFLFNMLLFIGIIYNLERILQHYEIPLYPLWLVIFVFNPFLIASLSSLNKEIIGFFIISSLLLSSLLKKWFIYILATMIAFLFRDLYGFVAILYIIMLKFRIKLVYSLILLSIIAPFCLDYVHMNNPKAMEQESYFIMEWVNWLTMLPFGYIIAFPIKAAIQLFAPAYSFYLLDIFRSGFIDYYSAAINISSLIFAFMICYIVVNALKSKVKLPRAPVVLFYCYLLLMSLSPYSIHRIVTPAIIPLYIAMLYVFHYSRVSLKPLNN